MYIDWSLHGSLILTKYTFHGSYNFVLIWLHFVVLFWRASAVNLHHKQKGEKTPPKPKTAALRYKIQPYKITSSSLNIWKCPSLFGETKTDKSS